MTYIGDRLDTSSVPKLPTSGGFYGFAHRYNDSGSFVTGAGDAFRHRYTPISLHEVTTTSTESIGRLQVDRKSGKWRINSGRENLHVGHAQSGDVELEKEVAVSWSRYGMILRIYPAFVNFSEPTRSAVESTRNEPRMGDVRV